MKRFFIIVTGLITALLAAGCAPEHDYTGDYQMTYTVSLQDTGGAAEVRGGQTHVRINAGLASDWLIDLGPSLCRLEASHVPAETYKGWPYFKVAPQRCWLSSKDGVFELWLGGTGTFDKDAGRLELVLTGSYELGARHGAATLQLADTW